jgi:hypothetical protein
MSKMLIDRALLKQALEALEFDGFRPEDATHRYYTTKAITALRAALEQEEQEPFGYIWPTGRHPEFRYTQQMRDGVAGMPLYTHPPRREWVSLTEEEIATITKESARGSAIRRDGTTSHRIARAIEAKLKERNHE